jgi:two-component system cell cycle sensor histidine kinase/response regulator CckA
MRNIPRWLTAVVAGALLVGGVWLYRDQEAQLRQQVVSELTAVANLKVAQITDWRAEQLQEGAELLARPLLTAQVVQWLARPDAVTQERLLAEFRALQTFDGFSDVLLVDATGQVRLSSTGATARLEDDGVQVLQAALRSGEPILTDLHVGDVQRTPHISVIAPVTADSALVLVSDAQQFLFPLIQTWPTASTSAETLLVRREGDDVLFLNDLRHRPDTALRLRFPIENAPSPAAMAVLGRTGVVEGRDYRGVDVLAMLATIPDSPWAMVAKIDAAEAFAAWQARAALIVALILSLLFLVGAAGLVAWQQRQKEYYRSLYAAEAAHGASEMRYFVTLNSIGDGVIATDAQGRIMLLNPIAEMLTGWTNEAAQGRSLEEVFHIVVEETRAPAPDPVARVLATGGVVGLANHTLLIARDGAERAIADAAAPIRDAAGTLLGIVLTFRDQTAARDAQRAREASEARNRAMVAAMPDLLFRIDGAFRFVDCQAGDSGRFLAPPEYFLGKTIREVLPPAVAERGEDAIGRALATGAMQLIEYDVVMPDGRRRWFEQRIAPINAAEVLAISRDITERRRAETLTLTRLHLLEYAATHNLEELLQEALDCLCELAASPVGFFHFVALDQRTLSLHAWSTRTLREFCTADGKWLHYGVDQAGVWADALRTRQPIVHNDFATVSDRKGMPEGHAELVRELVVPILRQERVVAILGVGNKSTAYGDDDVTLVADLADLAWEIAERRRVEEASVATEQLYRKAITGAGGVPYQRIYGDEVFAFLGEGFEALTGFAPAEMDGPRFSSRLHKIESYGEFSELPHSERQRLARQGVLKEWRVDFQFERKDGVLIWLADHAVSVYDGAGKVIGTLGILMDITERKRAEEDHVRLQMQLAQAQRLESVGRLAGGVAHDFNNMLAVILMRTEMAMRMSEPSSPLLRHLQEIDKTAKRSVELTRQLLGYARKQTIAPRPLDLNATVENMLSILHRLIGEEITLRWQPAPGLWTVQMDPSQVDQILANLCANARDAIDGVGHLIIKTENVMLDELYAIRHLALAPGAYVRLTVTDNGAGMSKETLRNVFEPFFTTKEQGKGTGLGLATVHGIVQQNGGHIEVYSEVGIGTTFAIYLPRVFDELPADALAVCSEPVRGNGETLLLVEDEDLVLEMATEVMEQLGYVVIPASTPATALAALAARSDPIDLLITDVIMPEMSGRELADRITAQYPQVNCLFMSGYPADFIANRGVLDPDVTFLQKPFSLDTLATMVRYALDKGRAAATSL